MGQDEVTVGLHRVRRNALFEVMLKQGQVLFGQPPTQARTLGEKGSLEFHGFAYVPFHMRALMHSDAAEETAVVIVGVQGQNSTLVAKPIGETTATEEQWVAIQDDFGINHLGSLVDPFSVGPSHVCKCHLFLPPHPVL